MPRSGKRSILQVQRKEISANTLQSKEYRLSITNWLAGSEPLIPVSNSRIARRICAFATDDKSPLVESEDAGYESTAEDSSESSDYTSDAPSAGGWSSAGGSLVAFDDASSGQSGSGSITSGGGASIPRIRCLKAAQYLPKNKGLTATKKKTKEKFEDTKVSTETLGSTPEGNNNDEKPTKETVNICSTRGINGTDNAAFQQEWTISEDAMMVSMRAGGETWLSIAAALGRAEEQVMERWCALVNRIATPGYTTLDRAEWTARAVTKTGNDADNELSEVYEKSRKPNKVKSGECGMNKTDGNCDCNSRKGEKPKDKDQVMTQNHKKLRKREATYVS
ncbi:hypothetical protein VTK73DRAFT_3053 [Phialemonium thermophilum]|uniref:Myb-like domain-containing protein n=1 Tax=Phialemonium thermophilum TaxID=223376 RepID=A0ABR3X180_9PEZI